LQRRIKEIEQIDFVADEQQHTSRKNATTLKVSNGPRPRHISRN
jgi:hypothetical protein